jgi:hypothetical protein
MKKNNNTSIIQAIVVVLIIATAAVAGISSLTMPAVVPASAPADEFSGERAMEHIRVIAQEPHPIGSSEIAKVRAYIVAQLEGMGLSPEVQQTTALIPSRGNVQASIVHNVIARIPGTNSSGAILLDAHYDSMPMTPGASDCGSCVATLLETACALQAGPPLQNDVILVFADDEELGPMAGAAAFVEQHPWIDEVGVALNYEGLGRTGPSIMFETGPDSGWLVREWGRAASHPVAQSWFYEVYRLTPYNTDFTKYAEVGVGGLNFAYWFEGTFYHTMQDNLETIDPRSVQHHGSNALSLLRRLGNLDLSEAQRPGDAVYFTLLRGLLVSYPASWAILLALLAGLLLAGVAVVGFRKEQLTIRGALLGLLAALLSVIAAAGLATGIWMGIVQLHDAYRAMFFFGKTYNAPLYWSAFVALAVAIAAAIHLLFRRKARATDLAFGALLLLWLLALATGILLPGFSYLFTWPLLFSALALGWALWKASPEANSWWREMVLVAGAVPGLIILTPAVVVMLNFAPYIGAPIFVVALLLGLLTPQLDLMTRIRPTGTVGESRLRRWWLSGAALLVCVGFLVAGSLTAGFDAAHPRPNGMAYILNADTGQATWFSPGMQSDAWTAQFYSTDTPPERGALGDLFPLAWRSGFPILHGEAPAAALDAPQVKVLDDQVAGGVRTLQLRLSSPRGAPIMVLDVEPRAAVRAAVIDGQQIDVPASEQNLWSLTHRTVPPEGIEITLEVEPSQPLTLQVSDNSRELPVIPGTTFRPRPDDMMPFPNFDYGTVVVRTLDIP